MKEGWLLYTDGSLIKGSLGWAYAIYISQQFVAKDCGTICLPRSNAVLLAEITAVISGLRACDARLPPRAPVEIRLDNIDLWLALSGKPSVAHTLACWNQLEQLQSERPLKAKLLRGLKNKDQKHVLAHTLARKAARG